MKHDRNKLRILNWTKAIRKRNLIREISGSDFYSNLHQYSKNKIHCSCPLCRGKDWSYGNNSNANETVSNRKKLSAMEEKLEDFYVDEDLN